MLLIKKVSKLILGFLIIAFGLFLMKEANIGMNPWSTFHYGLSLKTNISFGTISQIVGLFFILIGLFFKKKPSIGTILNMILIGLFINTLDKYFPFVIPDNFILQIIICLIGLIIFSIGVYVYLSCGLGAGPRDGFMLGLVSSTNLHIGYIKTIVESIVFIIGLLLGAPFGLGSILTTILGGPLLHKIFKMFNYIPEKQKQYSIKELLLKK